MEGAEDILSELWYRLQDESFVNAEIQPYLARINAFVRNIRRLNDPQHAELQQALQDVAGLLERYRLQSSFPSSQTTPRLYTGKLCPILVSLT